MGITLSDDVLKVLITISVPSGVVLILALVVILRHKAAIDSLIPRIKKIGGDKGIETHPDQSQKAPPDASSSTSEGLIPRTDSMFVAMEKMIIGRLEGKSDSQKIAELLRIGVAGFWGYQAMFAYHQIFGSQIMALKALNARQSKVHLDALRPFYDTAASQYPAYYQNYSYDQWLGFMHVQGLIMVEGDSLQITERGQEFLHFMIRDHLSENKAG